MLVKGKKKPPLNCEWWSLCALRFSSTCFPYVTFICRILTFSVSSGIKKTKQNKPTNKQKTLASYTCNVLCSSQNSFSEIGLFDAHNSLWYRGYKYYYPNMSLEKIWPLWNQLRRNISGEKENCTFLFWDWNYLGVCVNKKEKNKCLGVWEEICKFINFFSCRVTFFL